MEGGSDSEDEIGVDFDEVRSMSFSHPVEFFPYSLVIVVTKLDKFDFENFSFLLAPFFCMKRTDLSQRIEQGRQQQEQQQRQQRQPPDGDGAPVDGVRWRKTGRSQSNITRK